jgi:hypothetical protein
MLVLAAIILFAGCVKQDATPGGELSEAGKQFLLAEEPEGAVGILDFREAATEANADSVTLLGRIGGGTPVWSPVSAMFLISDPTDSLEDESGHVCHGDNCPFCKGKTDAKQAQAIAMLTTADGKVPAVDARKLLPLTEGQLVVIQGRPETNGVGQLVVHVRGIYLR